MTEDVVLARLLNDHRTAVSEFEARAGAIAPDRWLLPRAEGKWTPAEETRHLILTYQALTGNLRGERQMRLKGTPFLRRIWRAFGLTSVLYLRRIPKAVRAPREVRPDRETRDRDVVLGELEAEVQTFDAEFTRCWHTRPHTRLTHPFFGELDLRQAIRMAAVHTRHHAAFLPRSRSV